LTLIGPDGLVRAMVMKLTGPPDWDPLSSVWRGVQTELDLPAPAVAVSGVDGLQLWFSLAEPVHASQAHGFLESLRARFLPDVEPRRLCLLPATDASAPHQVTHADLVPARHDPTGHWSAFVAADLAPVFAETPWLEGPPNEEGQAALLRGLASIKPAAFTQALQRLAPGPAGLEVTVPHPHPKTQQGTAAPDGDPARFLRQVMNDDSVALAIRVEAAKALLQHSTGVQSRPGD
jgi:hypothetical protein